MVAAFRAAAVSFHANAAVVKAALRTWRQSEPQMRSPGGAVDRHCSLEKGKRDVADSRLDRCTNTL